VNLLSKMYGGGLRPSDPRRYLMEAIVGAMQADGVVTKEELEVLETSVAELEMFSSLSDLAVRTLIDVGNEAIAFAGGSIRRIPYMAKGLPSRAHRMAAYGVACEIALADGESPPEVLYLRHLKQHFLLGDEESKAIYEAAKKRRAMGEVELRTLKMQDLMPLNLDCMALMASADGTVTDSERRALTGVVRNIGDMAVLGEEEMQKAVDDAFRRVEGKDADREIGKIAGQMSTSDRYWAAVYMCIIALAEGQRDWRRVWLLGSAQEAFKLSDRQMDQAMNSAKLFPIPGR
jgi:tellurite resistance protein